MLRLKVWRSLLASLPLIICATPHSLARQWEDTVPIVAFNGEEDLSLVTPRQGSTGIATECGPDGYGCLRFATSGAPAALSVRMPEPFGQALERGCYLQFDARSARGPVEIDVALRADSLLAPQSYHLDSTWDLVEYPHQLFPAEVVGNDDYTLEIGVRGAGDATLLIRNLRLVVSTLKTTEEITFDTIEKDWNTLVHDLETPHIKWARPYAGGRPRVLVIAPRITMREVAELQQRFDVDCVPVMTLDYQTLGIDKEIGGVHGKMMPAGIGRNVARRLRARLRERFDAIVLSFDWQALPAAIREQIMASVEGGTGLLHLGAFKGSNVERQRLLAQPTDDSQSLFGVPLAALPAFRMMRPGRTMAEICRSYETGQGRVVVLDYLDEEWRERWYMTSLTPNAPHSGEYRPLDYEYYQSFLGKGLYLAAGRSPSVRITGIGGDDGLEFQKEASPLEISVAGDASRVRLIVEATGNTGVRRRSAETVFPPGKGVVGVPIGSLPHGRNYINVWLKEGDRVVDWASAGIQVTRSAHVDGIELERRIYRPEESIAAKVLLGGSPAPGSRVAIRLSDALGRVLDEKTFAVSGNDLTVNFRVEAPQTVLHHLTAELWMEDDLLSTRSVDLTVRTPDPDFPFVVWCGSGNSHIDNLLLGQLRNVGVDVAYVQPRGGHGEPQVLWPWLRAIAAQDLRIIPYISAVGHHGMGPIRDPCLTDPDYLERMERSLRRRAPILDHYDAMAYSLGDENSVSRRYRADICHSRSCQVAFRDYLQGVYPDLDALNGEWWTGYNEWSQVPIMNMKTARAHGNPAPWADHHMYKESLLAQTHRRFRSAIRDVVPDGRVGFEGIGGDVQSFRGRDVWKLTRGMELAGSYNTPTFIKWFQAFAEPGAITGTWVGADNTDGAIHVNEPRYHVRVWKSFFEGFNSIWYWQSAGMIGASVTPELNIDPLFAIINRDVQEIKGGLAKLLAGARRSRPQVAVYYSQPSSHADAIARLFYEKELSWFPSVGSTWLSLLDDLSIPVEMISYAQVAAGELASRDYQVLILPYVQALSDAETEAISAFVAGGGMALADVRPGVMTEHSRYVPERGFLREVFGVEIADYGDVRAMERIDVHATGDGNGLEWTGSFSIDGRGDAILLAGGTAHAAAESGVPAVVVNPYGRGRGVLLNFSPDNYGAGRNGGWVRRYLRTARGADDLANLILAIMDLAEVRQSPLSLTGGQRLTRGCSVYPHQEGEASYVGVLFDYRLPERHLVERALTLDFKRMAHVYEVRSQEYLGEVSKAAMTLVPGDARLYAALPYRVEDVSVGATRIRRGDMATLPVSVGADGVNELERHVVRVEVFTPDGQLHRHYSGNAEVLQGTAGWTIPTALNDPAGRWRVQATEVVSGVFGESSFVLE